MLRMPVGVLTLPQAVGAPSQWSPRDIPWSPRLLVQGAGDDEKPSAHRLGGPRRECGLGRAVHSAAARPLPRGGSLPPVAAGTGHRAQPGPLLLPAQGALQRARPRRRRNPISSLSNLVPLAGFAGQRLEELQAEPVDRSGGVAEHDHDGAGLPGGTDEAAKPLVPPLCQSTGLAASGGWAII